MKIKKGDTVLIISGKDRGKTGKVERVFPAGKDDNKRKIDKIIVEGINIIKKHVRPKREGQKGERIEISALFPASRAMIVCPECKKATRIGYKTSKDGKKQRICKKCKTVLK